MTLLYNANWFIVNSFKEEFCNKDIDIYYDSVEGKVIYTVFYKKEKLAEILAPTRYCLSINMFFYGIIHNQSSCSEEEIEIYTKNLPLLRAIFDFSPSYNDYFEQFLNKLG